MNEDALSPVTLLDGPRLAARLRPALVRFFRRRTGNMADAEDLAQDVLVSALKNANWETPERVKGYIFRAAVNRLRDRHRRALTHGVAVDWEEESLSVGPENTIERALIVREELSEIDRALDIRTRTVLAGIAAPGEAADVFIFIPEYNEPLRLLRLAKDLARRGWSETRIEKILGGNLSACLRRCGAVERPFEACSKLTRERRNEQEPA